MTLLEFIKSQVSKDTQLGDLAKDILGDKEFPADQPEARILSYLEFKLGMHANLTMFNKLLKAYEKKKDASIDPMDLEGKFTVLRSEQWALYKENFRIDYVYTVGEPFKIYRIYTVDALARQALVFELITTRCLNDITIIPENKINKGELTKKVSIQEAIKLLETNNKKEPYQPTEPNFTELLGFLISRIGK
jgi:uncharacterized protein YozE (UPF0346 family)